MLKIHTLVVGPLQTNCYVLQSKSEGIVIDPGDEGDRIVRFLMDLGVKPRQLIATHTHFDHVLGVDTVRKKFDAEFLVHRDDLPILQSMQTRVRQFMGVEVPPPPKVNGFLKDSDIVEFGDAKVRVVHTPGHSPGSISLLGDDYVLTGDALFNQSIGRSDTPGGDLKILIHSIKSRLFKLDDATIVYPGHGPDTTIGDEKLTNPFVGKNSRFSG